MKTNEQIISLIESDISDLVDSITNKEKQIKRLEKLKVIIPDSILDQIRKIDNLNSEIVKLTIELNTLRKLLTKIK